MQRLLIFSILKKSERFILNISKGASFITPTASKSKPDEIDRLTNKTDLTTDSRVS